MLKLQLLGSWRRSIGYKKENNVFFPQATDNGQPMLVAYASTHWAMQPWCCCSQRTGNVCFAFSGPLGMCWLWIRWNQWCLVQLHTPSGVWLYADKYLPHHCSLLTWALLPIPISRYSARFTRSENTCKGTWVAMREGGEGRQKCALLHRVFTEENGSVLLQWFGLGRVTPCLGGFTVSLVFVLLVSGKSRS